MSAAGLYDTDHDLLLAIEQETIAVLERCAARLTQLEAATGGVRRWWRAAARRAPATHALARWRRELAAGQRTPTTFDALWRAACEEMNELARGQR